jgi:transcriptional regulator with XRE-family HTH domain
MIQITLKAARVNAGLTQIQAAKLLGISNKTLCNWEKGYAFPTIQYIDPICELYGVSYDMLTFRPSIRLKRI